MHWLVLTSLVLELGSGCVYATGRWKQDSLVHLGKSLELALVDYEETEAKKRLELVVNLEPNFVIN